MVCLVASGTGQITANDRFDLQGPDFVGMCASFETLVKHTERLIAGSPMKLGGR
jgi:hypothetical protein